MMNDLGWKCPNAVCEAWNAISLTVCPDCGYNLDKNAQKQHETARVSILDTHKPVKIKKRGKNSWSYLGLLFDSSDEAWRYGYLLSMKAAGIIRHLFVQPTMVIRPSFTLSQSHYATLKSGKPPTIPAETYKADYAYIYGDKLIIEDVKGLTRKKNKKTGEIREYPYSKSNSDRSQKHLMYRYQDNPRVLFMLVTGKRENWRYWQASRGYPELNFELVAIADRIAA